MKSDSLRKYIIGTGRFPASKPVVKAVEVYGDGSFTTTPSKDIISQLPIIEGYGSHFDTAIMLKMQDVNPHTDPFVGSCNTVIEWYSVFWVVRGKCTLYNVDESCNLKTGDYVIFKDSLTHSVESNRTWLGIAWQLTPLKL